MGNRQTFHPNKLAYDVFNIEIDLGPVNLFLYGLLLKNLWWVKVSRNVKHSFERRGKPVRFVLSFRIIYSVGIKCIMIFVNQN